MTVLSGQATATTWEGTGLSFVVPFCVANLGVLVGTRRAELATRRAELATRRAELATGPDAAPAARPSWSRASEAPAYVMARGHLRRTALVALVVGTCYLVVNQLPVLLAGHPPTRAWVAIGIDYLVPFCVSNTGLLVAGRRRARGGAARMAEVVVAEGVERR